MPVNKKSPILRIIAWLHLWPGLISGLIVFIVSITGCLFVFQKEISELTRKKILFISSHHPANTFPLHILMDNAQSALGNDKHITYITAYADPSRAWEMMAYAPDDSKAVFFPNTLRYYESVFVNPYTGAVTGKINYKKDFFVIIKYIHWSLFLNTIYGQPIVGWSTLIFMLILITGMILWFPGKWNRHEIKKAFTIAWRSRWKRVNYDLHNVLGFYIFSIALILAFTGILFAFGWLRNMFSDVKHPRSKTAVQVSDQMLTSQPEGFLPDQIFQAVRKHFPNAKRFILQLPADSTAPIYLSVYFQNEVYYDARTLAFDSQTGRLISDEAFSFKTFGEKMLQMNYDIHVGSIGGITGKIIAFIGSLICASLPITGFIIWWGKRKKKTNKNRKPVILVSESC
ncbi:MAG: PepSY domain-containing protein [Thermoflavifilum aggregans]|nr:PepSY domain-containing protein [Thermoflavifilum aggregans]